jgi:hypothetical protein
LHDGRLTVYFDPVLEKVKIGSRFTFRLGLSDPAMPSPVDDELTVRIVEEEALPAKTTKKKSALISTETGGLARKKRGTVARFC